MFSQCLLYEQLVVHGLQLGHTTCETCIRSGAPERRRSLQYFLPEPHMGAAVKESHIFGGSRSILSLETEAVLRREPSISTLAGVLLSNSHVCVASTHGVWHPHIMCGNVWVHDCDAKGAPVMTQEATLGTTSWAPTGRPSCASARPSS